MSLLYEARVCFDLYNHSPDNTKKKKKPHPLIIFEKNMPEKLKILFVWPNGCLKAYLCNVSDQKERKGLEDK